MQEPSARLYDILVYHARKFTHHDAAVEPEDLVQTAFARGWATVEDKPERDQLAYLSTVVTNLALDRIRRAKRRWMESLDACRERGQTFPSAERIEEECVDRLALDDALVSERRLGFYEVVLDTLGYSREEIGRTVGVTARGVNTRIYRFRHPRVVEPKPPRPPRPPARPPALKRRAKLSPADIRAIRATDEQGTALAARYGVSEVTISQIRHRVTWRTIT